MTSSKKKQEIVPVDQTFKALSQVDDLRDIVAANLGEGGMSLFDLEGIRVGRGGSVHFTCGDEITGEEAMAEFDAVIAFHQDKKAWWIEEVGEGEDGPPDCGSDDGITGLGKHTAEGEVMRRNCDVCPYAQWGSDRDGGKGKDCADWRALFVLRQGREESLFPSVLRLPASSLGVLRKYLVGLTIHNINQHRAIHKFTLTAEKSANGKPYSRVKVAFVRHLEPSEVEAVERYSGAMKGPLCALSQVESSVDDRGVGASETVE